MWRDGAGRDRWLSRVGLLVGVILLFGLLTGLLGGLFRTPPPAPPELPRPIVMTQPPALEADIAAVLAAARLEVLGHARQQLAELAGDWSRQIEAGFLPSYLAFGRRTFEEIGAYNDYAVALLRGLVGLEGTDGGADRLAGNFQEIFEAQVLTITDTTTQLQRIGVETARLYATRVALGLENLRESRRLGYVQWEAHLAALPAMPVMQQDGTLLPFPIAALARPDPLRQRLGDDLGATLQQTFAAYPPITADREAMRLDDGRSIFEVGQDAPWYFASYVGYWIVLVLLIRAGVIPLNLSGALIGWLIWEVFAWSSWIALEWLDFAHTRAQLEPIILAHTELWITGLHDRLSDPGPGGPFRALMALEGLPLAHSP